VAGAGPSTGLAPALLLLLLLLLLLCVVHTMWGEPIHTGSRGSSWRPACLLLDRGSRG
jgi:hypothetical protein